MADPTHPGGGLQEEGVYGECTFDEETGAPRSRTGIELPPEQDHQLHSDSELESNGLTSARPKTPPLWRAISNPRPCLAIPQTSPEQHRRNRSIDALESPMSKPTLLKLKAKIPSLRRKEKGTGQFMARAPPRPERPESLKLEETFGTARSEAEAEASPSTRQQRTRNQRPAPLVLNPTQPLSLKRHSLMSPLTPGSAMIPIANDVVPSSAFPTPLFGRVERSSRVWQKHRIPESIPEATQRAPEPPESQLGTHPALRPSPLARWERVIRLGSAVLGPRMPFREGMPPAPSSSMVYHVPTTLYDGRALPRVCDSPPSCASRHGREAWYLPALPGTFRAWGECTTGSSPDSGVSTGDVSSSSSSPRPPFDMNDPTTWPPVLFVEALNSYFLSCGNDARLAASPFVDRLGDGGWYLHVPKSRSDSAVGFGPTLSLGSGLEGLAGQDEVSGSEGKEPVGGDWLDRKKDRGRRVESSGVPGIEIVLDDSGVSSSDCYSDDTDCEYGSEESDEAGGSTPRCRSPGFSG
ncbi:hypothetical protein MKZ38_010626 [Zalerion maritima]|uniref:Uncharacterized protein n=1 Tax=Zalerion maritima TaxID=339359 RepID=A0AAD5WMV0_9PEZI|nr:hypothetical protein MKZ38_010626 [Zalerion maritima]